MRNRNFNAGWKLLSRSTILSIALMAMPAAAQSLDDDFAFAAGLVDWGFSDYALKYAEVLLAANPQSADRVNLIRAQSLIATRKYAEAESILRQLPAGSAKADAIRLALANAYYATGDMDKARAVYDDFFARFQDAPSDADLLRFYRDAAYRYAVMLEKAGDLNAAFSGYDRVLKTNPEKDLQRRILTDQSQILLKLARANHEGKRDEYAFRTRKAVEDIQWGGIDIWFGQSIITLANVELIYNDEGKAQQIIKDNIDILTQIDDLLEENKMPKSLSPMAGARFLSGELSQRSAERAAGANNTDEALKQYAASLGEFYNVFVQYADSDVGPEAGLRAQAIKEVLETRYGRKVNIDLGARADEAALTAVRLADTLYRESKYPEAIAAYLKAANQFPESDTTIKSFGNLILGYARRDDTLMVNTLASYIAERFSDKPDGATALLAAAKFYVDKNDVGMYAGLYEAYLRGYPRHERAGTILFYLATQRKKAGDEAGAASYFRRIIDEYPQDAYYPRALSQVAWSFYMAQDYASAMDYFRRLIKETNPGMEQAQAQFNLADSLVRMNRLAEAAAEYSGLLKALGAPGDTYGSTDADRARVGDLREKASFQLALCLSRINEPADRVPMFREQAIKAYELFVQNFPASDLASRALNGKGTVQLELKRFDDASQTFDDLARQYPQTEEGKNALFSLARAAMEIKQFDQGVAAFQRMMNESDRYQAEEFIRLGVMMGDAGYANEAIRAFQEVQKKVGALPEDAKEKQRPLIERSLFGSAQAFFKANQFEDAIRSAQELLTRYPQSGLFYETKFIECEGYRALGRHQEAVLALNDVIRFASDSVLINRATVMLAGIQRQHGELNEALASYQRIALLVDRNKPENRPVIEDAFFASAEIAAELGRHADVVTNADDYAQLFPQGQYLEQIRSLRREALLKSASNP